MNKPYEAGSGKLNSQGVRVELENDVRQLLVFTTENASLSINNETGDWVFLPKACWTPINISTSHVCTNFTVKGSTAGDFHWQGWVI